MSRIIKTAAVCAAAAAAVAVTGAPALAWTNGTFSAAANANSLIVKVNGSAVATCAGSTLAGTINTAGVFSVTSASATGCGVTVTPTGFPWAGSFGASTATMTFKMSALGCTYTGSLTGAVTGARPPATVTFTNQAVSGSGFLCFSGVTVSAVYVFNQP